MAETICYIYIFHLTWLVSLIYLVKGGCSKFLPNTGFVTIRLLGFGVKVKRACCCDNFLAQRPQVARRRFFMFQQDGTSRRISTRYRRFPGARERERDVRNVSSSRRLVSVYAVHISSMNSGSFEPICHDS